jgi:geranylgeranyl pyrophosphate synthase
MVGGQTIDLAAAGRVTGVATSRFDARALEDMHARKTGALIRAASVLGAVVTGADETTVAAIDTYARDLGLAFQSVDDVLDVEGSRDALGKTAGKRGRQPPSWPISSPAKMHGAPGKVISSSVARRTLAAASIGGRLAELAACSLARTS